jgi:hypothetical protein
MKIRFKVPNEIKKRLLTKRQRFAVGVVFLSSALFVVDHFLARSSFFWIFILAVFTNLFLFWGLYKDLKENFSPQVFILPFLYTLGFGFFSPLIPARILADLVLTVIYAIGLYSLFLSQNIFTVSGIRTIALLSGARTVSFVITILTFLFITTVIFSLNLNVLIVLSLFFITSFLLTLQSIWTYTLEKSVKKNLMYVLLLTFAQLQVATVLWFWPNKSWLLSSFDPPPVLISLFLTGVFYIFIGLSHLWFEKRLFKSTLWEYVWIGFLVFIFLVSFTSWT